MKKSANYNRTGNYLDTRVIKINELSEILSHTHTGIILVTRGVILSGAKNLADSNFGDACTDLEIFRNAQDDTYLTPSLRYQLF